MKSSQSLFFAFVFSVLISGKVTFAYQPYKHTDPHFAASAHHLKQLVLVELDILTVLSSFKKEISSEKYASEILKSYIKDFESSIVTPLNNALTLKQFASLLKKGYINKNNIADDIIKHPFKTFRTIRRFVLYIDKLSGLVNSKGIQEMLKHAKKSFKFPKLSDLEASMQNILRLRQVFDLSVADLFEGRLKNLVTMSGLDIPHFVEIAEHAINLKMFTHAVDFFDAVLHRCKKTETKACSLINSSDIISKLESVIKEHDHVLIGNNYDRSDLNLVPPDSSPYLFDAALNNIKSPNFINRRRIQIDLEFEAFAKLSNHSQHELDMAASAFLYERICSGIPLKKPSENNSHYRCTYLSHTHSFYLIGPLKAEIHSEDPLVVQIYDVISNDEIDQLKAEVQQEMRQSRTTATDVKIETETGKTSRFRTSANAWIEDNSIEAFKYLNKRIALITGFNTTGYYSSEIVQIAAYNPGGHYTPHTDAMFEDTVIQWLPESEFKRGDRIMTFMLYLSDVEKGGATGFPTLRTAIQPVKGSAVVWYNLNSDGSINYNVLHGGCPVLYGTKWIANKWIRSNDQMFTHPCPKNREPWKI